MLGVDPGTQVTGWGYLEALEGRVVRAAWGGLKGKRTKPRAEVLADLSGQLRSVLATWRPQVVAVETPFVARFQKASLLLAETRGALLAVVGSQGCAVVEYEPARVKAWVVGNGRAEKQQVAWFVQRFLSLPQPLPPDAADALALALCHLLELQVLQPLG
ncbi:MAG: crossover junction endodeoxyribonuclease RuvC [Thermoanaerobaculum sp.]|nr:crossover junction endodeoxyribonuclease RuvC [Thermoanaerobaculum sp.]